SLAQHRPGVTRELLPPLEQHQVKSLFRAEVLVNELLDLAQQLTILENRELHVENGRFLGSGVLLGTGANLPQTRPRLLECRVKPLGLAGDGFVGMMRCRTSG